MSANQFDPVPMAAPQAAAGAAPSSPAVAAEDRANPIRDAIAEAISEHKVILFMKGTPDAPACGFSARTVAMPTENGSRASPTDWPADRRW